MSGTFIAETISSDNMALALLCTLLLASLASANVPANGCPPGSFVNGTECPFCPLGTYQPDQTFQEEREACKTCTSGSVCNREGLAAPAGICYPGYYCPQGSTASTSLPCPPNFYCPPFSSRAPSACSASSISGPGSKSYLDCKSIDRICSPGQYGSGFPHCSDCPSGTFQPSWLYSAYSDETSCQPCPVGQYCDSPKQAAPSGPCFSVPGYYCPMRSTSSPGSACPKGFYCPANNTGPIPCPGGTSSSPGAAAVSDCLEVLITCPPGTYKNGSECGLCAIGTYQPSPMSVDGTCKPCDPGSYCIYPRATSVTGPCKVGYYCPGGSTLPSEELCPEDHYCPNRTGSPLKCPNGTVSQNGETSVLGCIKEEQSLPDVNCGPGTYTDSTGNGTCEDCPAGTYQPGWSNGKGLYICKYCDEGKYCKRPGLAAPSGSCALGFYCPIGSTKRTEEFCLVNHYCPSGGHTPIPCPSGTISEPVSTDVAECTDSMECPSGYFSNGMRCAPCPEGRYKGYDGPDACSLCPENKYCSGLGNTAPTGDCYTTGYYCPSGSNSSTAYLCPKNHYCSNGDIEICYSGYKSYPGSTSSTDCSPRLPKLCPEGQYYSNDDCYDCPAGYYKPVSDWSGVDSCLACPAGSYCLEGSANPAGKCAAGYFCPLASGASIICPVDHYCLEGSGEATPCPAGEQSPPGSSSC